MITLDATEFSMIDDFLRYLYRETTIPLEAVPGPMLIRCAEMLHRKFNEAMEAEMKRMESEAE